MTKNGLPIIPGSAQAKSGSGTITPAANTACNTANSSRRARLDGMPVVASVRSTRACGPARRPSENLASIPQFSWIAPPESRSQAAISACFAPPASARKRDSAARSNGGNAVAAIDRDDRAGHISAGGRGEEQQRPVEILGLGDPLQRDTRNQSLARLGLEKLAIEIGLDVAGRQRIHQYPVTRQLHRQDMRQVDEPSLGRAIGRDLADRAKTQHRGDIDDPAKPLPFDQMMREFARRQPGALQIGVNDMIPIGLGMLEQWFRYDDSGIVDEDRHRPEPVFGSGDRRDDALAVGDVAADRQALPAAG